jgi:hypothetical protein
LGESGEKNLRTITKEESSSPIVLFSWHKSSLDSNVIVHLATHDYSLTRGGMCLDFFLPLFCEAQHRTFIVTTTQSQLHVRRKKLSGTQTHNSRQQPAQKTNHPPNGNPFLLYHIKRYSKDNTT